TGSAAAPTAGAGSAGSATGSGAAAVAGSGSATASTAQQTHNPPPPTPAQTLWRVGKSGGKCHASAIISCPEPLPGKPRMTCNPPRPADYKCPPGLAEGAAIQITQVGDVCHLPAEAAPTPSRQVPCPKY
ncbi:MAG: hypothetical protein H0T79_17950, partial [Deltaproteobacteria bacterium]|nr:hypothetical protein [Deltaproteobacteria bacterium]